MFSLIKNRNSLPFVRLLAALLIAAFAHAGNVLPVFLADNHAETFGWITRNFDPDRPHVLVLVDAHSDASAAERSDDLREELRRVPSEAERAARVERWRSGGRLQAFNWIEPLMPRPVEQVLWLAAPALDGKRRAELTRDAVESLDGRLEVEPRSAGSFDGRWETCDMEGFLSWNPGKLPVILCIDLDFFAGMGRADREERFEEIWQRAMDWPGLAGVAFSVSRPWLVDDAEADELVSLALDAVRFTRGARLEIDASLDDRPDDSSRAGELGERVPRWDLAEGSQVVKARLGELGERLAIHDRVRAWSDFPAMRAFLRPDGGEVDCDGVWRFAAGDEPVLRIANPPHGASGKVRWKILEPAGTAYDLWPETGLGKDFSESPGRWIYEKRSSLGITEDFMLDPAAWRRADGGRVRIAAEYETEEGWLPAAPVEMRVRKGEGFHGALSECLGMPYVFGVSGVAEEDLSGVETGWGSDCANLLVYAWRRCGVPLGCGDPGRLRAQLAAKAENVGIGSGVKIGDEEIRRGIAVDFGNHVAAVWEDREPSGVLDGNDLVMHHLGGFPEIVALSRLAERYPKFDLLVPGVAEGCRVAFAGDVVLAGEDRVVVEGFGRGEADLFVVNLEGIPSSMEPGERRRYDFRFPPERLKWLKEQGVDAVSLANNHALDAGRDGLVEGMERLVEHGIAVFGAGKNEDEACRPWRVERAGVKLAFFGISYLGTDEAGADEPGVAGLPAHGEILEREIHLARSRGERVIAVVHGGEEYRSEVNSVQRRRARWLVARGVSAVVGAHPHVIQREEIHGGAAILHSLGNAVYPAELKGVDSGEVRLLGID